MRKITISLDNNAYRRVHIVAAQCGIFVSALVKTYLIALGSGKTDCERSKREEHALRDRITEFRAADRVSRDASHDRGRAGCLT
jgi:hypothetical protein